MSYSYLKLDSQEKTSIIRHTRTEMYIASVPGLPTTQFLICSSMQEWRGRRGYFIMCTYLGIDRGEGKPVERTLVNFFFCSVDQSTGVPNLCSAKTLSLIVLDEEQMHKTCYLKSGSLHPSFHLGKLYYTVLDN